MAQFQPGNRYGIRGRPKGSPNRTTAALKADILASFRRVGGVRWLVKLAEVDPASYARLLGRVLPKEAHIALEPVSLPEGEDDLAKLRRAQRLAFVLAQGMRAAGVQPAPPERQLPAEVDVTPVEPETFEAMTPLDDETA